MELHNLKPAKGSVRNKKRVGRGQGSGRGGTSTRGMNGAGSRSGTVNKFGFEGGQMPLQRRVPKFGFKNLFRKEYHVLNLDTLQSLADKHKFNTIDYDTLHKGGIVKKDSKIKILGRGEIKAKLELKVNAITESAKKAVEAAGGSVTII